MITWMPSIVWRFFSILLEEYSPERDCEGMRYHTGLDAFRGSPCKAVKYPGSRRHDGKSPVGESVAESKVYASEQERCSRQSGHGAGGPFGDPLLQQAAEKKLFRQ